MSPPRLDATGYEAMTLPVGHPAFGELNGAHQMATEDLAAANLSMDAR